MNTLLRFLAPTIVIAIGNGCATSALWTSGNARHFQPAKPPNLILVQARNDRIAAVYNEASDTNDKVIRRAFWIDPAAEPSSAGGAPKFIEMRRTKKLPAIPILGQPAPAGYSAVLDPDGRSFVLFLGGEKLWRYKLPDYERNTATGKQVALTPVALVADLTILGGYLFLQAWGHGSSMTF